MKGIRSGWSCSVFVSAMLLTGCYADFSGLPPEGEPPCECPDDGNVCTDEFCDAAGICRSEPNSAACDDDDFCNGADTCADGACTVHAGDPCGDMTSCNPEAQHCAGCLLDRHCPDDEVGEWSECVFSSFCAESGEKSRQVTTYSCEAGGVCTPDTQTETRSCTRMTEGLECGGAPTCGDFGACEYADACAETGTKTRICNAPRCESGSCQSGNYEDTDVCTRQVDDPLCQPDAANCEGDDSSTLEMDAVELELVRLINEQRANAGGLDLVFGCTSLATSAQQESVWLRDNADLEPDPAGRICAVGYTPACSNGSKVAEIAAIEATPAAVLAALMNDHQDVVLARRWDRIGIGHVCDATDPSDRWVVHFGDDAHPSCQ